MERANASTCLICLGFLVSPKNLYDAKNKKLLELLLRLLGFQIEVDETVFNVCATCEGRLVWLEEFKDLCEKSLEKFKKLDCKKEFIDFFDYGVNLPNDRTDKQTKPTEDKPSESESEVEVSERPKRRKKVLRRKQSTRKSKRHKVVQNDTQEIDLDDVLKDLDISDSLKEEKIYSDDDDNDPPYISDNADSSDLETKRAAKRLKRKAVRTFRIKSLKRKRKIKMNYFEPDVRQAIADCKSYITDIKHLKCILCEFETVNLKGLWNHMPLKHRVEYPTWCKYCNIQPDDLQKHRNNVRCFEAPCKFCKRIFPNKMILMKHLQSHFAKNIKEIRRPITLKQYPKEEVVNAIDHIKQYITDLKCRTCIHCSFIAVTNKTLSVHIKIRHRECYDTWCRRCNLQTENLKLHRTTTKCLEVVCPLCQKKYNRINRLTVHLKSHCRDGFIENETVKKKVVKDKDVVPCAEEEKSKKLKKDSLFSDEDDDDLDPSSKENKNSGSNTVKKKRSVNPLRKRMPRPKAPPKPCCLLCSRRTCNSMCPNYVKHKIPQVRRKQPSGPANSLCTVCGKLFKNNQILKVHMRLCTGDKAYKCPICEKLLPNKTNLLHHERRHTGEKPFLCPVCGRRFISKGEQKLHMQIHEGGPVSCTICNKEFIRPGVLALHMKRHTGENAFKCMHCEMSYHRASLLKNHMRSHSNERPYKCSFCDKDFSCRSTLKKHENVHKGIKPYKCSVCSFSCGQAHGLSSHMKQHPEDPPLPDRPYKCLFCYRQFDTNAMLMSHTTNQHREQTDQD